MAKVNELNNKTFLDKAKAREWLQATLWPTGAVCGHCGALGEASAISTRPGWYQISATPTTSSFRSRSALRSSARTSRSTNG
jgi:hypothetical protein